MFSFKSMIITNIVIIIVTCIFYFIIKYNFPDINSGIALLCGGFIMLWLDLFLWYIPECKKEIEEKDKNN